MYENWCAKYAILSGAHRYRKNVAAIANNTNLTATSHFPVQRNAKSARRKKKASEPTH
jgi:hypothetical protein